MKCRHLLQHDNADDRRGQKIKEMQARKLYLAQLASTETIASRNQKGKNVEADLDHVLQKWQLIEKNSD
jgi:hypothetical protein